ncbi:uncharacterized protein C8R40DRAFT_1072933 [Lentinula edodes]|uniref:uncharacterized protein n=1 Tax=Lentinula edodes TaxID=5353 RepID=UPI001E8EE9AD|nr:uncharacterized protein C8R40DRAFT_1072933 [Lentinula edodes]KAH7870943.1 hypothetical protein C8R40DRAFT_1072933 [Lentinula edodes]
MSSHAYTNLLQHLHRAQPALPLETIQSALAFHIANHSLVPTPLAATAITSPLFLSYPFTLSRLQTLSNSFRHAIHLKFTLLSGPRFTFFERSISAHLAQWTKELIKGLQGGNPLLRLAAASGILLGLEDLRTQAKANSLDVDSNSSDLASQDPVPNATRAKVEDEVVIAFAEVMDQEGVGREWESEFQQIALLSNSVPDAPADQIPSPSISLPTLSLILAAQSLPLVASSKLKALPLTALSQILTSCITEAFNEGDFLHQTTASETLQPYIASLSRLEALVLSLSLSSRPREGLSSSQETLNRLQEIAVQVVGVIPQLLSVNIPSATMAVSPSSGPWITLKTLLFSIIMISDSVLSACLYIPPTDYRLSPTSSLSSPASLSLTTLLTLFRLSFVVSQFGGISSMGGGEEASFKEMRKAAYLALDILASGPEDVSERFIDELMAHRVSVYPGSQELGHPQTIVEKGLKPPVEQIIELAKISFALSCIEQLVPVLSIKYLKGPVWNLVEPNLDLRHSPPGTSEASSSSPNYTTQQLMDQLMRETFESAHSVVLAILAANATNADLKGPGVSGSNDGKGKAREEEDLSLSDFCTRLVPFYSRCLIQNSAEGKLSTSQLRIAYAALVRSACSSVSPTRYESDELSQYTLAWYCISKLLSAIQNLGNDIPDLEQKHRLHITFIACVSALPLSLLGRFFEEIDGVLRVDRESKNSEDMAALTMQDQNRTELIQALYRELSQMVGDREKEYVLRWWSAFAAENTIAPNRRTISKL